ncbi:MAG: chemotaxis protein [Alphaproteobacteria bacterium]|nr:chemotaxis protein [Alphaproteobacteria bacterium]
MQDDVLNLAFEVSKVTAEKIAVIDRIMLRTQILSMNARLEASRAGTLGQGFGFVAREMGAIADEVSSLSSQLQNEIAANTARIETAGRQMMLDFRGQRFADLARNVVEIIDRNLYERSCDVRWWATDSAVVDAVQTPSPEAQAHASARLATILKSYTVYLDLWIANRKGIIVASGRGDRYSKALGQDVSGSDWFRKGMRTTNGDDFAVCDISSNETLHNAQTATYSTAIRKNGEVDGAPIGVLGIFFNWEPQARDIVQGVALTEDERKNTRVMLLNARHRVIAASDGFCKLDEHYPLKPAEDRGYYEQADRLVSYALTPGYETYQGLGWYGCIESRLSTESFNG